jgi:HEAT repeats
MATSSWPCGARDCHPASQAGHAHADMGMPPRSVIASSSGTRIILCLAVVLGSVAFVRPVDAQVPGVESFVRPPKTPAEIWDVVDYLVRAGQPAQAVPFLKQFQAANPDDATLVKIRDQYGESSFFRLLDNATTRPFAEPLLKRVAEASRKVATEPQRLQAAISALSRSRAERNYGVERLREAGPYAVPPLVQALGQNNLTAEQRAALIDGLGALSDSAVPPLIATLDSPEGTTIAAATTALAMIGDPRAVPALTAVATKPVEPGHDAARRAISRITGKPFESQPKSPVATLTDAARAHFLEIPKLPDGPAIAWSWDEAAKAPAPRDTNRAELASTTGLKLAREALGIAPADRRAQTVLLEIALERDPNGATPGALAAGPVVLGEVVRQAIADGRAIPAAAAAAALGQVTDRNALGDGTRPGALVEALDAPDRRVQFAAARALVGLDPRRPFPGSSRVVPVLARFVASGPVAKAVVIDGSPPRGSQVVGFLKNLGYDAQLATTGEAGFKMAAESADVELVAMDPDFIQGSWRLLDTVSNLRADSHTASIPVFVYGSMAIIDKATAKLVGYPDVKFFILPTQAGLFKGEVDRGLARLRAKPLSAQERAEFAKQAAALLVRIATRPGSPFEGDLTLAVPALIGALNNPAIATAAATSMGDVPRIEVQRTLADTVLNPSLAPELRLAAAESLARSLRRFGPLLAAAQETQLVSGLDGESDPAVRGALAAVVGALKPRAASSGRRLQEFRPVPGR